MMTKRKTIKKSSSRRLFRVTANKTNVKNLPGRNYMMRGGPHF